MPALTKDEALAFVEALRLQIDGKTGFGWFAERLSSLTEYMEKSAAKEARFNAYLDWADCRDDYEGYAEVYPLERFMPGGDKAK